MKVAVFGSDGQLGRDVMNAGREVGFEMIGVNRQDADVTDAVAVQGKVRSTRPAIVINCAAFVRVEECERQPSIAFETNAIGALHAARAAEELRALCVFMGTDYVFDGKKDSPYTEDDAPNPINVYGTSKLAGEILTRQACGRSLIVRTSSLFGIGGARGKPAGNFVEAILRRAAAGHEVPVINDILISPTYSWHAAQALVRLIAAAPTGTVHIANRGTTTWYGLASAALRLAGLDPAVLRPISSDDFPSEVRRPRNSCLATRNTHHVALSMPSWQDGLEHYFRRRSTPVIPV